VPWLTVNRLINKKINKALSNFNCREIKMLQDGYVECVSVLVYDIIEPQGLRLRRVTVKKWELGSFESLGLYGAVLPATSATKSRIVSPLSGSVDVPDACL